MNKCRIAEIDFARGIAIVLMVIFHLVVDLKDFYSYDLEYLRGFWYYEGKLSAIIFMLVSGISSSLGGRNFKNGLKLLAWGMLLTAVTYLYNPNSYIRFGILHFLGSCLVFTHFIRFLPPSCLVPVSLAALIAGNLIAPFSVETVLLIPVGLTPRDFVSLDYYPLLPWLGVFLSGRALGLKLYPARQSLFRTIRENSFLAKLGRQSLLIYLIHQPVLLALLRLIHR